MITTSSSAVQCQEKQQTVNVVERDATATQCIPPDNVAVVRTSADMSLHGIIVNRLHFLIVASHSTHGDRLNE